MEKCIFVTNLLILIITNSVVDCFDLTSLNLGSYDDLSPVIYVSDEGGQRVIFIVSNIEQWIQNKDAGRALGTIPLNNGFPLHDNAENNTEQNTNVDEEDNPEDDMNSESEDYEVDNLEDQDKDGDDDNDDYYHDDDEDNDADDVVNLGDEAATSNIIQTQIMKNILKNQQSQVLAEKQNIRRSINPQHKKEQIMSYNLFRNVKQQGETKRKRVRVLVNKKIL